MATTFKITGVERLDQIGKNAPKVRDLTRKAIVKASMDFANKAIRSIKVDYLTGPRPDRLGVGSGRLRASIRLKARKAKDHISLTFGTDVPYARIHEYGGVTHPKVTDKMRAWAWRQFKETGNSKFKGLALTKKTQLTVKIRKRPFMGPGVYGQLPWLQKRVVKVMAQSLEGLSGGK